MDRSTFYFYGIFFAVLGCAHQPVANPSATTSAGSNEQTNLFQKAESAFKAKAWDRAGSNYRKVRSKFKGSRFARLSAYRLGSMAYQRRSYGTAAQLFEEMTQLVPGGNAQDIEEFRLDATYNLAACEFQQRQFEKAYQTLSKIDFQDAVLKEPKKAEMAYALVERTATKLGDRLGFLAAVAAHAELNLPSASLNSLVADFERELTNVQDGSGLMFLLKGEARDRVRPISEIRNPLFVSKIKERLGIPDGRLVAEQGTPTPMPSETPMVEPPSRSGSGAIGVILPLSGKVGPLGKRLLETILQASKVFDSTGGGLRLVVEDSQSSDQVAESAVERMVEQHWVSVVLGPVGWKEAVAVARKCQELGVLNLSLTSHEGVTDFGSLIFQNALIPKVQVESLAEFSIQVRSLKRFAILAPDDGVGTEMAERFWDAVERFGGKVVAYERYPADATDFQQPIQSMVGLKDPQKFRTTELEKISEFHKRMKKENSRYREKRIRLQPIIDFEALYIPDTARIVAQIIPTLSYFDVEGAQLLGSADWGAGNFYRRAGKAAVGAFFPVALHLESRVPSQFTFIQSYKEALGVFPDLLAAQTFEAIEILRAALQKALGGNVLEIASAMSSLPISEGPLGKYSFDEKRVAQRKLPIFSIDESGKLVEVSK